MPRELTVDELLLKGKLDQAAKLLSYVVTDKDVYEEIKQFGSSKRTTPEISFAQVLGNHERATKGAVLKFSNLKNALEQAYTKKTSEYELDADLLDFLVENDCGIWCINPLEDYSDNDRVFTITGHPIDEMIPESPGYIYGAKNAGDIIVNEEYVNSNPVLVITPNFIDFEYPQFPIDDIGNGNGSTNPSNPPSSTPANIDHEVVRLKYIKLKTVWSTIFWTRYFDLYVLRGEGSYNPASNTLTGSFPTNIYIRLPRKYAKDEKWYPVNIEWDTKWTKAKTRQIVGAYRYKNKEKYTIKGSVGYKKDSASAEMSVGAEFEVSGRSLGNNEWDRDWFYNNNHLAPVYKGNKIRSTSNVFDMTFSISKY